MLDYQEKDDDFEHIRSKYKNFTEEQYEELLEKEKRRMEQIKNANGRNTN